MNIENANTIPMAVILDKLGLQPAKQKGHDLWYLSPLRLEKTASFHVHSQNNVWYDFGEGAGGDVIAFVSAYLKASDLQHSAADALRWLRSMVQGIQVIKPVYDTDYTEEDRKTVLSSAKPLEHVALLNYLNGRGIPQSVAKTYLKEIRVFHKGTGKQFFAAGIENEDGGYDYRNMYFKGCVGKKSTTFIRGKIHKPDSIHIFEGFMDFLSVITQRDGKILDEDSLILNSLGMMKEATAYIRNYGYTVAHTWLDNDKAGKEATENFKDFFKTCAHLKHKPMNDQYAPYKDVNAAHMVKLGLGE